VGGVTAEDVQAIVAALVPEVRASVERLLAHERTVGELALKTAMGPLSERVAAIEARPLVPGPPGEKGEPGAAGAPGRDGAAGTPGLSYRGVFVDGQTYDHGDGVTYAGSMWHCNADGTGARPGDGSKEWTLMVKRGRDGKDARP
jgi:hypothetical protein